MLNAKDSATPADASLFDAVLLQRKVQAESQQMIPDTEKRLAKAVAELEELVVCSRLVHRLLYLLLTTT